MCPEEHKNLVAAYNKVRLLFNDKSCTINDLHIEFKKSGFTFSNVYLPIYIEEGIIVKDKKNKYSFPNPRPEWQLIVRAVQRAVNDFKFKKAHPQTKTKVLSEDEHIKFAIELLKSHGYKVSKPVTSYEEI